MNSCPTSALVRLEDGRVVVDSKRCNGTKACVPACPYGAISIHRLTGRAEKCDFCVQRTRVGLEPACVEACPTQALRFGDMEGTDSPVAKYARTHKAKAYKASAQTRPSVLYVGSEAWMEQRARSVSLGEDEDGVVYE